MQSNLAIHDVSTVSLLKPSISGSDLKKKIEIFAKINTFLKKTMIAKNEKYAIDLEFLEHTFKANTPLFSYTQNLFFPLIR